MPIWTTIPSQLLPQLFTTTPSHVFTDCCTNTNLHNDGPFRFWQLYHPAYRQVELPPFPCEPPQPITTSFHCPGRDPARTWGWQNCFRRIRKLVNGISMHRWLINVHVLKSLHNIFPDHPLCTDRLFFVPFLSRSLTWPPLTLEISTPMMILDDGRISSPHIDPRFLWKISSQISTPHNFWQRITNKGKLY